MSVENKPFEFSEVANRLQQIQQNVMLKYQHMNMSQELAGTIEMEINQGLQELFSEESIQKLNGDSKPSIHIELSSIGELRPSIKVVANSDMVVLLQQIEVRAKEEADAIMGSLKNKAIDMVSDFVGDTRTEVSNVF